MGYKTVLQKPIPAKDEGKGIPCHDQLTTTKDLTPCHVFSWPVNFKPLKMWVKNHLRGRKGGKKKYSTSLKEIRGVGGGGGERNSRSQLWI